MNLVYVLASTTCIFRSMEYEHVSKRTATTGWQIIPDFRNLYFVIYAEEGEPLNVEVQGNLNEVISTGPRMSRSVHQGSIQCRSIQWEP